MYLNTNRSEWTEDDKAQYEDDLWEAGMLQREAEAEQAIHERAEEFYFELGVSLAEALALSEQEYRKTA